MFSPPLPADVRAERPPVVDGLGVPRLLTMANAAGRKPRRDPPSSASRDTASSTVRFRCAEPGASTFLDVKPQLLHQVWLNGAEIDLSGFDGARIALTDLAVENLVVVTVRMRYSNDGQGLHRAFDPADGQHNVYGYSFLDAVPRAFACFDQPDLKAPDDGVVSAPVKWIIPAN